MPVFDLSPAVRCKRIELHKVESYCSYLVRMVYCSYCRHFVIMINNEMSVDWIRDSSFIYYLRGLSELFMPLCHRNFCSSRLSCVESL